MQRRYITELKVINKENIIQTIKTIKNLFPHLTTGAIQAIAPGKDYLLKDIYNYLKEAGPCFAWYSDDCFLYWGRYKDVSDIVISAEGKYQLGEL